MTKFVVIRSQPHGVTEVYGDFIDANKALSWAYNEFGPALTFGSGGWQVRVKREVGVTTRGM